jgi:hypothetical protein
MLPVWEPEERHTSKQWERARIKLVTVVGVGIGLGGWLVGYSIAKGQLLILCLAAAAEVGLMVLLNRVCAKLARKIWAWGQGTTGEETVASYLDDLGDSYRVLHDVADPEGGNFDHIVIGPTGFYVLETKNWRGTVTADLDGEVVLNGTRQDGLVRRLTARVMRLRDEIGMSRKEGPWVQGVLVAPHSWVAASFGDTGRVHCVWAGRLLQYLRKDYPSHHLDSEQVKQLSDACRAFAIRTDERFRKAYDQAKQAGGE